MGEKKALKLLQRAKTAPAGWSRDELIKLYEAFGFYFEGTKHYIAKHPDLPAGTKATITRSSGEIHPDYVRTAVVLIELVLKKKGK